MNPGKDSSQMSHPPHLVSTWSSALIPFCAYKTDLNISRNPLALPGISFPLCSSFLPTILGGQLCYKLTLDKPSSQWKENQLMLVLDYNEDRSLQTKSNKNDDEVHEREFSSTTMNFGTATKSLDGSLAKVQVNTLSPYVHFGGGRCTMTAVKRMTAKSDFLKMPLSERRCEVELYEDCETRKLFEECNCVPWEVPGHEVNLHLMPKV